MPPPQAFSFLFRTHAHDRRVTHDRAEWNRQSRTDIYGAPGRIRLLKILPLQSGPALEEQVWAGNGKNLGLAGGCDADILEGLFLRIEESRIRVSLEV